MRWVRQWPHFSSISTTQEPFSASIQPFWCHPHTLTEITNCLRWTNTHSWFGIFSLASSKASSNCLSHSNPVNWCPHKFSSRGTMGSSILSRDFDHLCRGRSVQTSGHSVLGIFDQPGCISNFTWVQADTASAAQLGNTSETSMIFTASHLGRSRALNSEHCAGSRIVHYNVSSEDDSASVIL